MTSNLPTLILDRFDWFSKRDNSVGWHISNWLLQSTAEYKALNSFSLLQRKPSKTSLLESESKFISMDDPVDGLNSRLSTAKSRQRTPVIDNDDLQVVSKKT